MGISSTTDSAELLGGTTMISRMSPLMWPLLALASPVLVPKMLRRNRVFKENPSKKHRITKRSAGQTSLAASDAPRKPLAGGGPKKDICFYIGVVAVRRARPTIRTSRGSLRSHDLSFTLELLRLGIGMAPVRSAG